MLAEGCVKPESDEVCGGEALSHLSSFPSNKKRTGQKARTKPGGRLRRGTFSEKAREIERVQKRRKA